MNAIRSRHILTPDGFVNGFVYIKDGRIVEITEKEHPVETIRHAEELLVLPGFIDLHTHGGGGASFDEDEDEIRRAVEFHLQHGTTTVYPTVSAAPLSFMGEAVARIRRVTEKADLRATVAGVHLEGPYLSKEQAGAQCPDFITPPREEDYLPLLQAHGDFIARWTYAPENDPEGRFAKSLAAYGVLASAGHSNATYDEMQPALREGCRLVTHLYSCTSTVTRVGGFRRPGVIETAYLEDGMFVEIICDGKHLPPPLIRLVHKIKGAERVALVTDSLSLAGSPQTEGWMGKTPYIIEDGVCKLRDRSAFAGSIATADRLLRVAVKEAGLSLTDAVRMLTETPANLMGLKEKGRLRAGCDADLLLMDERLELRGVMTRGRWV